MISDLISQIVAFLFGVLCCFGVYFSIEGIAVYIKLEKHRKEWLEIKSGIPIEIFISNENGLVKAELSTEKQQEAYTRYCERLMACEHDSFTGACFPPFDRIEKNGKTILAKEQDIPDDEAVKHLVGLLWKEIGNQDFVIVDRRLKEDES